MARVLVTGGSGFLGSLLISKLLDADHDVANIDLLPSAANHPRLHSVIGDIRDKSVLRSLISQTRPEVVFHCAALLAHASINERELWSSNVDGTRALVDAMAEAGLQKIIYTSSNCLWGTGFDHPVKENEPPAPIETYGRSKWECEKILLNHPSSLIPTVIRCPTIIDEGRLGLLSILFEFIADGRRVWTVGRGDNRYQFIYAADLIDAMIKGWQAPTGGVYGIGSDDVTTMRDTYAYVIEQSGSHSRLGILPKGPTLTAMRLAHTLHISPLGPYHYRMIASSFVFDTHHIKEALGWCPSLSNNEMLLKAYRYYHDNRREIDQRQHASAHRQSAKMGIIRLLKWLS